MTAPSLTPNVEDCYRRHSRELWSRFYAICSDSERAWEAVHESFVRFQEQTGQVIRDERAWLLHVGKNWLRDFARRKHYSTVVTADLETVPATTMDPAGLVAQIELRQQVDVALNELRSDDREILMLRYALNWSSQRIGDVLGIRVASVDMRLSRARQRMAEVLERMGINAESMS